jgi:hypothetical protein
MAKSTPSHDRINAALDRLAEIDHLLNLDIYDPALAAERKSIRLWLDSVCTREDVEMLENEMLEADLEDWRAMNGIVEHGVFDDVPFELAETREEFPAEVRYLHIEQPEDPEATWFNGPGWYFADECEQLVGPFSSESDAAQAFDGRCASLAAEADGDYDPTPMPGLEQYPVRGDYNRFLFHEQCKVGRGSWGQGAIVNMVTADIDLTHMAGEELNPKAVY